MEGSMNLLPTMDRPHWNAWSPRDEIAPAFLAADGALTIRTGESRAQYGKWISDAVPVSGGGTYDFCVEYEAQGVASELVSIHVILSFYDGTGKLFSRDYATAREALGNGRTRVSRRLDLAEQVAAAQAELCVKWAPAASVTFRSARVERTEPLAHRRVRVAAAFTAFPGTLEGNLEAMLDMIDRAGREGADILCLTEAAYSTYVRAPLPERSVPIPGDVTRAIGQMAKEHNMYVVAGLYERDGDVCYNSAVLIGRAGDVEGVYRKVQLPLAEVEDGLTPGEELPVFDTDFGRIGMMICWDQGFPEIARALCLKGAEIILLPTLWYTEAQAAARAAENGVFLVVACPRHEPNPARVIAPDGTTIAHARGGEYNETGLCAATIDLDRRYYMHWLSVGDCLGEGHACYMQERRVDLYDEVKREW